MKTKTSIHEERINRINFILKHEGITQSEFAGKIDMAQQNLSRIMRGKSPVTEGCAERIEKAFPEYSAKWILGYEDRLPGHWIVHNKGFWSFINKHGERDGWFPDYECSNCGSSGYGVMRCGMFNYCPNCGSKMFNEGQKEG